MIVTLLDQLILLVMWRLVNVLVKLMSSLVRALNVEQISMALERWKVAEIVNVV